MSDRPDLVPAALAAVVAAHPALGRLGAIVRNGLSVNAPACLFTTDRGTYFAKAYAPGSAAGALAEHRLVRHLTANAFPTPAVHLTPAGESLVMHAGRPYAVFDLAEGSDRYGDAPVFAPFGSTDGHGVSAATAEARSAGAALARFHQAVTTFETPAPRPFEGLTVRLNVLAAPSIAEGLDALRLEAPTLGPLIADRPEWDVLLPRLERLRAGLAPHLAGLERGVIHGDFIKRNLLWEGDRVSAVLDFDLWNVAPFALDLAIALLPTGFDWPRLLAGGEGLGEAAMRAMLEGYESVRPLAAAERAALPWLMESARFEFYLSAMLTAHRRGRPEDVETFWRLADGVVGWFAEHPDWRGAIA